MSSSANTGGQTPDASGPTPASPLSVTSPSTSSTTAVGQSPTTPTTSPPSVTPPSTSSTTAVGQSPTTPTTIPSPSITRSATPATSLLPSITNPASSATSSLSSVTSQAISDSSSQRNQKAEASASTTTSESVTSSSATATSVANGSTTSNNRLSNGAVAGIVVGVALGLALLTFLATFVIVRRQQRSKSRRSYRPARNSGPHEMGSIATRKKPISTEANGASATYEDYLPQSADDKTIQQQTQSTLDQIELHVENFYRHSSSSALRPDNAELAKFDSPYLPASLATLLPRSNNRRNIMKHALAQAVTSSISPSAGPARSFLPTEYTLLPDNGASAKAGFTQIMSRWRVMTAYLRPDPTQDVAYIAQRDRQIKDTAESFAKAFAPWKSTGYKDEERAQSLSAILEDAANLGIYLFAQPSTMKFHWPAAGEVRSGRIVVSPALLRTTDEKGRELVEAKIMVDQVVLDA